MGRSASKNSPKRVLAAERTRLAIALRIKGATYPEISRELGYRSSNGAWKAVDRGLDQLAKANKEDAERLRQIELVRLDYWLRKLDKKIELGDHRAIRVAIRLSESRRRLLGIDKMITPAAAEPGAYQLYLTRVSPSKEGA